MAGCVDEMALIRSMHTSHSNHFNATLGIQDSSRTVGLLVAFNQDYVRDSLAVRIVPLRQWLAVDPTSRRLMESVLQQEE